MDFPSEAEVQSNLQGMVFVRTEIDLAGTFLDVADTSSQAAQQERSRGSALTAYRSSLHYLPRLQLTPEEAADIHHRLEALRTRLVAGGAAL